MQCSAEKGDQQKEPRKSSDKVLEAYWCQGYVSWSWYLLIEDLEEELLSGFPLQEGEVLALA